MTRLAPAAMTASCAFLTAERMVSRSLVSSTVPIALGVIVRLGMVRMAWRAVLT